VITNLLPGLRDLRAPLVAGAILLSTLYLLLQGPVVRTYAEGRAGSSIEHLVENVGRSGWLVVASVTAYLLGSIFISARTVVSNRLIIRYVPLVTSRAYLYDRGPTRLERSLAPFSRPSLRRLGLLKGDTYDPQMAERVCVEIIFGAGKRLLVANELLYGEYDKLRAEAEFRDAVAVPIVPLAIACVLSLHVSLFVELVVVTATVVVALVLALQARFLDRQAFSTYAHAVADGLVSTALLDQPDKVHRRRWSTPPSATSVSGHDEPDEVPASPDQAEGRST
jgi:hypothetical protein